MDSKGYWNNKAMNKNYIRVCFDEGFTRAKELMSSYEEMDCKI